MHHTLPLKLAFGLLLAISAAGPVHAGYAAVSDPSPAQIYLVAARNRAEAQRMIQRVLAHHPESAVAHWVAAVLDVRDAHFQVASQELATAERLAPGLSFVSPDAVADLRRQLQRTAAASAPGEMHVVAAIAASH